jgi:hypothetical protein
MTSTLTIGPQQQRLEGRTVRDIVEHDPAQVNEVWCRKIFRQLLQSLELQYAMHMPHRAITPDTVVFHDNGEPLLLPSDLSPGDAAQDEAADMAALARVVHFAITRELAPTGPLRGRQLEGYSDSLITAVDRCMAPDPAERPRGIDELRHILGIVSLGPAAPASMPATMPATTPASVAVPLDAPFAAAGPAVKIVSPTAQATPAVDSEPSFMRDAAATRPGAGLSRWQRWAVAAGGGAVLIAIALALFAELRDSGSYDHIVLTLPQTGEQAHGDRAPSPAPLAARDEPQATAPATALPPAGQADDAPALPPPSAPEAVAGESAVPPAAAVRAPARSLANAFAPRTNNAAPAASGSALYRLQIQPWGVVYVDGVDRGVSPPVKRLVLTPGRHTIRIANPNFHDRVLEVDTSAGGGQIGINFSDEPR